MSKKLLSLLLATSSFAVYYLLLHPLYSGTGGIWQPSQSIQDLSLLNSEYDMTLAQAEGLRSQAEALRADYERIPEGQKAQMKVMVPNSIDKVRLLSEISGMLTDAGFSSKDLTVSDSSSNSSTIGSMDVSFTVRANYENFKALMNTFEKSMRLYSIQTVSFTGNADEEGLTNYTVKLQTYYIK